MVFCGFLKRRRVGEEGAKGRHQSPSITAALKVGGNPVCFFPVGIESLSVESLCRIGELFSAIKSSLPCSV